MPETAIKARAGAKAPEVPVLGAAAAKTVKLEDGYAGNRSVLLEELGHAELLGENRGHRSDQVARRISMSTPAGR